MDILNIFLGVLILFVFFGFIQFMYRGLYINKISNTIIKKNNLLFILPSILIISILPIIGIYNMYYDFLTGETLGLIYLGIVSFFILLSILPINLSDGTNWQVDQCFIRKKELSFKKDNIINKDMIIPIIMSIILFLGTSNIFFGIFLILLFFIGKFDKKNMVVHDFFMYIAFFLTIISFIVGGIGINIIIGTFFYTIFGIFLMIIFFLTKKQYFGGGDFLVLLLVSIFVPNVQIFLLSLFLNSLFSLIQHLLFKKEKIKAFLPYYYISYFISFSLLLF